MRNLNFADEVLRAQSVRSRISRLREELGNLPNAQGGKRTRKTRSRRQTKRK